MSLPIAKERVRRKEERPSEIIAAALELFVERGFAATRLDDVARRAGVSKGTPYLYFKNKEDLFRAVVTETIVTQLELGEQTLDQFTGSSEELLRLVLAGWWEFETSKACGIRKLMIAEAGNCPSVAEFYVTEVVERGKRFVGRVLERGI